MLKRPSISPNSGSGSDRTPSGSKLSVKATSANKRDRILRRVRGGRGDTSGHRGNSPPVSPVSPDTGNAPLHSMLGTPVEPMGSGAASPVTPGGEGADDIEDIGQYVNYEAGFVYQHTAEARARGLGLHAIAHFGWGVKNVGGGEIPVFVDVLELRGKLLIRLLLSAQPPFLRSATVTFLEMPEFDISARPLKNLGFASINAFDIPLLRGYRGSPRWEFECCRADLLAVAKSIAQVAGGFIRPHTYTLDVDRLLLGREAAMRTQAIGVLFIQIHRCKNLPRMDTVGTADPYVAVSYSKFKKPAFSTRTIVKDLNPIWEEPCFGRLFCGMQLLTGASPGQRRDCDLRRETHDPDL